MIGRGIKYLLNGYNGNSYNPQYDISQIVGDNIFPNVLPQNYGLPSVVYTIIGSEPSRIKELRAIANTIDIDIDVIADSYSQTNQISTLIISNLHRYTNNFNSSDSDGIGYGTPTGASLYGMYAPPSTGSVQYIGGLQITDLSFQNAVESFDEKLENYRNTINFKLTYIDDPTVWGSDLYIKSEDLNLMAKRGADGSDPKYVHPIAIDEGVNYLFSPYVFSVDNPNISSTTLDGIYEVFYANIDVYSGGYTSNRPTLKQSADTPPIYNGLIYLNFGTSDLLLSSNASDRLNRKYKEITVFSVFTIPDSTGADKSTALMFRRDATSDASSGIIVETIDTGGGATKFEIHGMALETAPLDTEEHRGFTFLVILSYPALGINPDLKFTDPIYFAASFKRDPDDDTKVKGEYELISSSARDTGWGDGGSGSATSWSDSASSTRTFKEYCFNFECLHSDIASLDTRGAGTMALNDELNIYDLLMWPDQLTFGSNKYNQIKRNLIEKHNLYNT